MSIRIRTLRQEIHLTTGSPTGKREKFYDLATAVTRIHAWEYAVGYPNRGYWVRYFFARLLERHDLYRLDDHALLHALAQALVSGSIRVGVTDRSAPMSLGTKTPTSQGVKADEATTPVLTRQPKAASMAMVTSTTSAGAAPAWVRGDPKNFDDAVVRLHAARQRIDTYGYQPKYTDSELEAMRDRGVVDDRFIVYVCKGQKKDTDVVGYKRASGRTTAWTATFDQVEDADMDPSLLCAKLGMPYDTPGAEYTMIIIDTAVTVPGSQAGITFVPTFKKLTEVGTNEFAPEGFAPRQIEEVMTPAYAQRYQREFKEFKDSLAGTNTKTFDPLAAEAFAAKRFATKEERGRFMARQHFANEIGTNEMFTGNGLTKVNKDLNCMPPGKQYGALETLTFEKNPPTVGQKRAYGGLRSLTLK